jgi:hypothetical protein
MGQALGITPAVIVADRFGRSALRRVTNWRHLVGSADSDLTGNALIPPDRATVPAADAVGGPPIGDAGKEG